MPRRSRKWSRLPAIWRLTLMVPAILATPAFLLKAHVQPFGQGAKCPRRTPKELVFLAQCADLVLILAEDVLICLH